MMTDQASEHPKAQSANDDSFFATRAIQSKQRWWYCSGDELRYMKNGKERENYYYKVVG
jgi:hypothetical protein